MRPRSPGAPAQEPVEARKPPVGRLVPGRRYRTRYGSIVQVASLGPNAGALLGVMARIVPPNDFVASDETWWQAASLIEEVPATT